MNLKAFQMAAARKDRAGKEDMANEFRSGDIHDISCGVGSVVIGVFAATRFRQQQLRTA